MSSKFLSGVIAATIFLSVVLTSCGQSKSVQGVKSQDIKSENTKAETDKKVTISFWVGAATPDRDKVYQESVIKPFQAKYSNITVDYLGIPGDNNAYTQKLDMAVAAGSPPDVAFAMFSSYIMKKSLEPLDDYFSKWVDKGKINSGALDINRDLDVKERKLYGIPSSIMPMFLWVRSDWFKEANLKLPETWDELFSSAITLTDKSKGRYGLSIRGGSGSSTNMEYLMYSYSGITEFFTKDGKCTINDPLNVEFVEKYLGMFKKYTPEDDLNKGWTELAATFQSGKAGIIAHNSGSGSSHEKAFNGDYSKFQAIPYPKSKKGTIVHPAPRPDGSLTIFNLSKNKAEAWKFIEFCSTKDINSECAKLLGNVPANQDALSAPWLSEKPYMKTGAELLASPNVKFYSIPYFLPQYTTIESKEIDPNVQKVMLNMMTAKELCDDWAKKMEKAKADFDAANK